MLQRCGYVIQTVFQLNLVFWNFFCAAGGLQREWEEPRAHHVVLRRTHHVVLRWTHGPRANLVWTVYMIILIFVIFAPTSWTVFSKVLECLHFSDSKLLCDNLPFLVLLLNQQNEVIVFNRCVHSTCVFILCVTSPWTHNSIHWSAIGNSCEHILMYQNCF